MFGKFIIKLHAHVVIGLPTGSLLCVTPPEVAMEHINFIRDMSVENLIINNRLPTKSFPLVKEKLVEKFVSYENESDSARLAGDVAKFARIQAQKSLIANDFLKYVKHETGRNDPCFCGTGLKCKQCCGKNL
ncbi:MAG TPA: hypothetical protein VL995_09705 [Cellvibrio sp.]|nr:hypothetical protein [Cellvibrio sp.]